MDIPTPRKDGTWQGICPPENRRKNNNTVERGRRHADESLIQEAVREAVSGAGLAKLATCHTVRHLFDTHLPEGGYNTRTVQDPLGGEDMKTRMIDTHVRTEGLRGFAPAVTVFEKEVLELICIGCRNKPLSRAQVTYRSEPGTSRPRELKASCRSEGQELRIMCRSV